MPLFVNPRIDVRWRGDQPTSFARQIRRSTHRVMCRTEFFQVDAIPYTLTGKKMEVPVRRILMGLSAEKAANRAAMANVQSLDYFVEYARTQRDYSMT